MPNQYPHLVVRLLAAVYKKIPITFNPDAEEKLDYQAVILKSLRPAIGATDQDPQMSYLIKAICDFSVRKRQSMSIILSKDHCIYVEPDGTYTYSLDLPSSNLGEIKGKLE